MAEANVVEVSETPVFNACYDQIKLWISKDQDVTVDSVLSLIPRVMRVVQVAVKERRQGSYKKKLVLSLLRKLLEDNIVDDKTREGVLAAVDLAAPPLINITVDIALGNIDLSKQLKKCGSVFSCCRGSN